MNHNAYKTNFLYYFTGRRVAEQELAVLTARLLAKYRVEWDRPEPLGQHFRILFTPDVEPRFRFIPRK